MTETMLTWSPGPDAVDGQAWLGLQESERPLLVDSWTRDGAGGALVSHVQVIGRRGSGRSATVRALLGADLQAGREVLVLVDGAGAMSDALSRWSVTGRIARTPQEWADAVTFVHAVLQARLARRAGRSWSGPSQHDPIVTLYVENCHTHPATAIVLAGTGPAEQVDLCKVCFDLVPDLIDLELVDLKLVDDIDELDLGGVR